MAKKPPLKKLIELAQTYAGCVNDIATACSVDRNTVTRWKKLHPEFNAECDNGNNVLVDLALKGLKHLLEKNSERTVHYTLDRLARDKGFGMLLQVRDKSKVDDELDEMSDEEILKKMEESRKRIKKSQ